MPTLLLFAELSPTEHVMQIIGFAVLGLLAALVIVAAALTRKTRFDTRSVVYGGICVALSFALSFARISMGYGGSITLASMLPLFLYCYVFGAGRGIIAGIAYGILQFVQQPFFLNAPQFFLDYIFPFAAIALAAVFKKMDSKTARVMLGITLYSFVRLISHIISGITFYNMGWIVVLPLFGAGEQFSAFIYSLLYNSIYMVPETIILYAATFALLKTKSFDRLTNMMKTPFASHQPDAGKSED